MKIRRRWFVIIPLVLVLALTLYSGLMPVPPDVPTGAAQPQATDQEKCARVDADAARSPQTLRVHAGERIQDAVDYAQPGDTILV